MKINSIIIVITLCLLPNCNKMNSKEGIDSDVVNQDLSVLKNRMKVPDGVLEVKWVEYALGENTRALGPTDFTLVAILKLTDSSAAILSDSLRLLL